MWWTIAKWVALAVVSYTLRPKPPAAQPPATLEEFDIPLAKRGQPIPVLFGSRVIKNPNVLWYGDLSIRAIKKKGGKK